MRGFKRNQAKIVSHTILFRHHNNHKKIQFGVSHVNGNKYDVSKGNMVDEPSPTNMSRMRCHRNPLRLAECPHLPRCAETPPTPSFNFFVRGCSHNECYIQDKRTCLDREAEEKQERKAAKAEAKAEKKRKREEKETKKQKKQKTQQQTTQQPK